MINDYVKEPPATGHEPEQPVPADLARGATRRRELGPVWLVGADVIAALGAVAVSRTLLSLTDAHLSAGAGPGVDLRPLLVAGFSVLAIWMLGGYRRGAFRPGRRGRRSLELLFAAVAASWATIIVLEALGASPLGTAETVASTLLVVPIWILTRFAFESTRRRVRERVVIVGSGHVCLKVLDAFRRQRLAPADVIGIVDDDPAPMADAGVALLGSVDDLPSVVDRYGIDRIVIAYSQRSDAEILDALRACDGLRVDIDVVPRMFDLVPLSHEPAALGWLSLENVPPKRHSRGPALMLKRCIDIAGAAGMLLLLAPLLAVIAAAIKLDDGGPIFYRQSRVGRDGRPFKVLKFRTMVVDADKNDPMRIAAMEGAGIEQIVAAMKTDDDRITPVGRVLRRTSFDEFPQLWNVIRGEMSLVGPRPLRDFEVQALEGWHASRQSMLPGITGLWQVSGRSDLAWDDRLKLDYDYVRHWSIAADFQILARTVGEILGGRGAR
jgi:exopolysaccharide biosynthesis polyprenyl glycosylphosphotransferase